MCVAGIVSEYNPFHLGHEFHINETRKLLGETAAILCVMSGNFAQRGDFTIFNKHVRAKAAVFAGADLVVELPVPYVLSSAEWFAGGSVALLHGTGVVTHISFGSECGNLEALRTAATALRSAEAGKIIGVSMKKGMAYGAACQAALEKLSDATQAGVLRSPNDLLAISYINALAHLGSAIRPIPIKRAGTAHDAQSPAGGFASASHLRKVLRPGGSPWAFMPASAANIFLREIERGAGPIFMENCRQGLLGILRLRCPGYEDAPDNREGLFNKLCKNIAAEHSIEGIVRATKTKRYHASRIRRLLLSVCIGIRDGDRREAPPYIRVLAVGDRGRRLLREMSHKSTLPIVTKPAKIKSLDAAAQRMFELESACTDIHNLGCPASEFWTGGQDWKSVPYVH